MTEHAVDTRRWPLRITSATHRDGAPSPHHGGIRVIATLGSGPEAPNGADFSVSPHGPWVQVCANTPTPTTVRASTTSS